MFKHTLCAKGGEIAQKFNFVIKVWLQGVEKGSKCLLPLRKLTKPLNVICMTFSK